MLACVGGPGQHFQDHISDRERRISRTQETRCHFRSLAVPEVSRTATRCLTVCDSAVARVRFPRMDLERAEGTLLMNILQSWALNMADLGISYVVCRCFCFFLQDV